MTWAIALGADTIYGINLQVKIFILTREWIIVTRLYQLELYDLSSGWNSKRNGRKDLTWEVYRGYVIEQAEQGVAYFTDSRLVVLLRYIQSRQSVRQVSFRAGGSIYGAVVVLFHHKELPIYSTLRICEILTVWSFRSLLEMDYVQGYCRCQWTKAQFSELRNTSMVN